MARDWNDVGAVDGEEIMGDIDIMNFLWVKRILCEIASILQQIFKNLFFIHEIETQPSWHERTSFASSFSKVRR